MAIVKEIKLSDKGTAYICDDYCCSPEEAQVIVDNISKKFSRYFSQMPEEKLIQINERLEKIKKDREEKEREEREQIANAGKDSEILK